MGFGISHQKAGLNRPGKYKEWCREKAIAEAWRAWVQRKGRTGVGCGVSGVGNNAAEHAKWRRITGITAAHEACMTAKERRRGLKRLVAWIENRIQNGTDVSGQLSVVSGDPSPGVRFAHVRPLPGGGEGKTRGHGDAEKGAGSGYRVSGIGQRTETELSLMTPFGRAVEEWARPGNEGRSVENLCVELQISRARLTMLTKEYCGLTVQELMDGFKVRKLKSALVERLREAAQELWGLPGTFAAWKTDGYRVSGFGFRERQTAKQSRYFRMRPEDYACEERGDERARRIGELVVALRRNFDLEDWAARVGFASGARLKRACLNVLGRSLRALERAMAEETVRYYICAEDKVLRQVACGDDNNPRVARARWIYGRSEDAPKEPFLDEWSKAEELARDWLDKMRAAFGST